MANAWIEDLWLTGDATAAERRSLNNSRDPMKARVAAEHRKTGYGTGSRWTVYWWETEQAGRRRRRKKRFDTRRDAEAFRDSIAHSIRTDEHIAEADRNHTVGDAFRLRMSIRPISGNTRYGYTYRWNHTIAPRWEHVPVGDVTRAQIERWIIELTEGTPDRKPIQAHTIHGIINVLKGSLETAVEQRWIHINPAKGIRLPKPASRPRYLTAEQVEQVARFVDARGARRPYGNIDGLIIRLLAATGLRISEMLALNVEDIRTDTNPWTILVSKTVTFDEHHHAIIGPTKTRKNRSVPIPDRFREPLRGKMDGRKPDDPLWFGCDGGRAKRSTLTVRFLHPALRAVGIPDQNVGFHILRHTCATLLLGNGVDVKTVQDILGHETSRMTLDIYAAALPDNKTRAASIMDELLTTDGE